MKYYYFDQNNSGGRFHLDDQMVGAHVVAIQAKSAIKANQIAESLGIYFYGTDDGRDCECCGDRWYGASESDATEEPCLKIWKGDRRITINEWLNPPEGKKIRKSSFSFGIGEEWKMIVHHDGGGREMFLFDYKGNLLKSEKTGVK